MLTNLVPVIALAMSHGASPSGLVDTTPMRVTTPRAAQRMLADALGTADSVDFVLARDRIVTFGIDRAGEAYEILATIDAHGRVVALEIGDVGRGRFEPGRLSWLTDVMKDAASVARLDVEDDGEVVVITNTGERYLTVERTDGNAAVEARWGAAWNT
jgi:hypothetical protein